METVPVEEGVAGKADAAQRAGVRAVEEFETGLVAEVFGVAEKVVEVGIVAEKVEFPVGI